MRPSFSPGHLLVLVLLLAALFAFIQIGVLRITFEKLGLSETSALTLVLLSLTGSLVNLPLTRVRAEPPPPELRRRTGGLLRTPDLPFTGYTLLAVNVGGGLVPFAFSLYLVSIHDLPWAKVAAGVAVVAAVAWWFSRPIPGRGIGLPIFVAPLTAAAAGLLLSTQHSAPLAYVAGTLGVLLGADILRIPDVRRLGAPVASIGGAGTFDGIFLTGIVAALLA